jgi:hypothetical protein
MLETSEITKSLPPPRDDEPASLRQDIVDEIRDHIQCSLRRELLVGRGDETQARQRVLNRFGNPHVVARRLWFQAMWSRIMTQRLVIGSLVCSMMVSITLVVMVGVLMGRMDQQQRDQQAFNMVLIEKMGSLMIPAETATPRDPNWNHLQIKLTTGTESGPPATDVQVFVSRQPAIGEVLPRAYDAWRHVTVDQTGLADCDGVTPGNYTAKVRTTWDECSDVAFKIRPGFDHLERIIVPANLPELTKVSLQVDGFMSGPKAKHLLVGRICSCDRDIAGRTWSSEGAILNGSGHLIAIDSDRCPWVAEFQSSMLPAGKEMSSLPDLLIRVNWSPLDSKKQISLPANTYRIRYCRVALNDETTFNSPRWRNSIGLNADELPEKYDTAEWRQQTFKANAAEPNHWTITIPNEIFEDDARPSENSSDESSSVEGDLR